jgi:hypothetical protein
LNPGARQINSLDQSSKNEVQKGQILRPTLNSALKRGALFYTQKDPFDSPDTLDYASVVSLAAIWSQEGF